MSKQDQNRVNLGPARIKTDDAIYDAVDQGIVGTSTTVVTPTTPGFVPIGPIGDLITPPVLAPVTGYPIYATDIAFNDGTSTYPFLSLGTPWGLANLSGIGSFTNSLVVNAGISALAFVNLDNPSQRTTYAGKQKNSSFDYTIRDGVLTHGWSYFVSGAWVEDSVTITIGGSTRTITGATLNTNIGGGVADYTHRYFYLANFGGAVGHAYARILHTGPLTFEVVGTAPPGFNPGVNPQDSVQCVENGVLWIKADELSVAFAMDVATGDCTSTYAIGLTPSYTGSWFGLLSGEAAFLGQPRTVGSNFVNDLYILGLDGSVTTQSSFITYPTTQGALTGFVPIPGSETMLATNTAFPTIVYQIGTAGYQTIGGLPYKARILRLNYLSPGTLRFWGSNATDTEVALYEVAL